MHKLKLNLEMLAVESFVPGKAADDASGTVRGHSYVTVDNRPCGSDEPTASCGPTDYQWETCIGYSCLEKCAETYVPTCSY